MVKPRPKQSLVGSRRLALLQGISPCFTKHAWAAMRLGSELLDLRISMTAKIIRLEHFNVGCRHPANGIRFPLVYRVTGFEFDLVDGDRELSQFVPGTTPVEPFYTLSNQGDFGVANPSFQPVKVLDPTKDKGRIVVRHHTNRARAEAYIDGIGDLRPLAYPNSGQMLWQTADGVFTILHRPAPIGMIDHLIAYITKVPVPGLPDFLEDAHHIVHADGTVTSDGEILYPSESDLID